MMSKSTKFWRPILRLNASRPQSRNVKINAVARIAKARPESSCLLNIKKSCTRATASRGETIKKGRGKRYKRFADGRGVFCSFLAFLPAVMLENLSFLCQPPGMGTLSAEEIALLLQQKFVREGQFHPFSQNEKDLALRAENIA